VDAYKNANGHEEKPSTADELSVVRMTPDYEEQATDLRR
jgi:hypothetical protein